ncbi:hypothetical protein Tco_0307202 [Tanacetum coccineum]
MSDSEGSAVTYTSVYTDSEPGRVFWGTDEEVSEGGVPRVIVYGYDGFPIQPVPQDEDEREPRFIEVHDTDFVPEPIYPEYIPLEDEHVFPAEEQPLPPVESPTAESPGYAAESDPEEDPEYEDDEEQDGPVDYPMGEGDDGGDDDGDSSGDDADDEDEDMEKDDEDEEEEEEEKHIALADSTAPGFHSDFQASDPFHLRQMSMRLLCIYYSPLSPLTSLSHHLQGERLARLTDPPVTSITSLNTDISRPYEAEGSSTARPTEGSGTDYRFVSTVDYGGERQRTGCRMTPPGDNLAVEDEAYAARDHRDHVYAHEIHLQTLQTQLPAFSVLSFRTRTSNLRPFSDATDSDGNSCEGTDVDVSLSKEALRLVRDMSGRWATAEECVIQREIDEPSGKRGDKNRTGCYTPKSTGGYWGLGGSHLAARQIMVRTRRGQTPPPANPNKLYNIDSGSCTTMIRSKLFWKFGGGDEAFSSFEK